MKQPAHNIFQRGERVLVSQYADSVPMPATVQGAQHLHGEGTRELAQQQWVVLRVVFDHDARYTRDLSLNWDEPVEVLS